MSTSPDLNVQERRGLIFPFRVQHDTEFLRILRPVHHQIHMFGQIDESKPHLYESFRYKLKPVFRIFLQDFIVSSEQVALEVSLIFGQNILFQCYSKSA